MIELTRSEARYGRDARARLAETLDLGRDGARAALETFYWAFNSCDLELLTVIWLDDPLAQMDDPVGGVLRGRDAIAARYSALFTCAGRRVVELADVLEVWTPANVIFTGCERGELVTSNESLPLTIRTTHCFAYVTSGGGWRLVHHHGSLDDPALLARYQALASAAESGR